MASKALEDPEQIQRLARALSHRNRDVWEAAYGALVELGPRAVPTLRDSIERRKPEAGRALLVLGEMGDPAQAPLIRAALDHRTLDPFARAGIELCEQHSWERLQDEPDLALAQGYLEQFPRARRAQDVRALARELTAWEELSALGPDPAEGALIRIERLYGDTPAGERARSKLADSALARAAEAIGRGQGAAALRLVTEARDWDPSRDFSGMEAAARAAAGAEMAGRDLDGAIAEMEAALAINGSPHPELAALYLRRARRNFKRRRPAQGMADLQLASRTPTKDQTVAPDVDALRRAQLEGLLASAARPDPQPEVMAAVLLAGRSRWAELENLIRGHLARGDGAPLVAVTDAAWTLGGDAEQVWVETVLTQLLFEVDGVALSLLEDPAGMAELLDPQDLWAAEARAARAEALPQLMAYVGVIRAADRHIEAGGVVDGALPAGEPRDDAAVRQRLMDGYDPRDEGVPRLDRVQLLALTIGSLASLEDAARRHPDRLVAALCVARVPADVIEWAIWSEAVQASDGTAILGGQSWKVSVISRASTIRVELEGPAGPASAEATVGALTALYVAGRPLMMTSPAASRLEVLLGAAHPTYGTLDPSVRLALSRVQLVAVDWDWVIEQGPLTAERVYWVPDRTIR